MAEHADLLGEVAAHDGAECRLHAPPPVELGLERRAPLESTLRVSGALRPGWCGNLSTGLAELGIDIVSGHAVRQAAAAWQGRFELRDEVRFREWEDSPAFNETRQKLLSLQDAQNPGERPRAERSC